MGLRAKGVSQGENQHCEPGAAGRFDHEARLACQRLVKPSGPPPGRTGQPPRITASNTPPPRQQRAPAERSFLNDASPHPPRRHRLPPPRPHGPRLDRGGGRDHRARLLAGRRVQRRLRHPRLGVQGGERPHRAGVRRLLRARRVYVVWKDEAGRRAPRPRSASTPSSPRPRRSSTSAKPTPIRVSEDGTIGTTTLPLTVPGWEVEKEDGEKLIDAAEENSGDGLEIKLGGDPIYRPRRRPAPRGSASSAPRSCC